MFTRQELATLAAALRFWRDEMLPHEPALVAPYFEGSNFEPLPDDRVDSLIEQLGRLATEGPGPDSPSSGVH